MSETIWVSDSDVCEMCNGLLDWFGQCPHCGWDSYPEPTYYEDEEDPFDPMWISSLVQTFPNAVYLTYNTTGGVYDM